MNSPSKRFAVALTTCSGDQLHFTCGSRSTVINAYLPDNKGLFVGVDRNGCVWTDCIGIGSEASERLVSKMSLFNVDIDTTKKWCFWKRDGKRFYLSEPEIEGIAEAVAKAAKV